MFYVTESAIYLKELPILQISKELVVDNRQRELALQALRKSNLLSAVVLLMLSTLKGNHGLISVRIARRKRPSHVA